MNRPYTWLLEKKMEDVFSIYVDQLKEGKERIIDEILPPDFIEVKDLDLSFDDPVHVKGKSYLAETELVIHWDVETKATMPCAICNEPVKTPLRIEGCYYSEPLDTITSGIFSFRDLLRETILLETPLVVECQGNCPKRLDYQQFLKNPSEQETQEEEGFRPFVDLDWKQ